MARFAFQRLSGSCCIICQWIKTEVRRAKTWIARLTPVRSHNLPSNLLSSNGMLCKCSPFLISTHCFCLRSWIYTLILHLYHYFRWSPRLYAPKLQGVLNSLCSGLRSIEKEQIACHIAEIGTEKFREGQNRNCGGEGKDLNIVGTHVSVFPCLLQQPQSCVQRHEEP